MGEETYEAAEATEAIQPQEPSQLSAKGIQSMQGGHDSASPLEQDDKARVTIDNDRLSPETREALRSQDLTSASIADDRTGDQAEACTRTILEREGIPDGSGQMEPVNRVVPGTHDGKHGIDLIAVTQDGRPTPIEVKKRADVRSAALEDRPTSESGLEPEIQRAKEERERDLQKYRDEQRDQMVLAREYEPDGRRKLDTDYVSGLNPDLQQWASEMEADLDRSKPDESGVPRLPVEQMDDFWVKDRYLKLLRSDEGTERLMTAGARSEYCKIENFVDGNGNLKDTPLWDDILSERATVVVSPSDDSVGDKMFRQAVFEGKSRKVIKISL